tara:strand:- start:45883 stop:46539 length:657 start_codon:yes stop_codon:yes gene_type:complete
MRLYIALLIFITSCSGYQVVKNQNPFEDEGIRSITVPMFVNRSSLSHVSGPFTQEIIKVLKSINGLRVYSGEVEKADAILIGVIDSAGKRSEIFKTGTTIFTEGELEKSIGNRAQFYVPSNNSVKLTVQYFLIKDPTYFDKKLVKSEIGKFLKNHPKIVFNSTIGASGTFTREIESTELIDGPGITNFSRTKNSYELAIRSMARSSAQSLKQTVIYVF